MASGRALRALLVFLLLALAAVAASASHPRSKGGRLVLDATTASQVLPMEGEWGFAWQQFIDPGWTELPTTALALVPSSWNAPHASGKPEGQDGWGSYALLLDCPAGQSMAIEPVGQRTASRLFINGQAVAAHGEPGTSAASTVAAVHSRTPITREFDCPLRLTLHIANFDHRAGGFVRPMYAGPADRLAEAREERLAYHVTLVSAYGLVGLVALIFFLARRRETTPLLFGLFCLAMAAYTDLSAERLLLRPWPPQVPWPVYVRAEYLSWIVSMGLFLLTLRHLFPAHIHRRAVQAVMAVLAACSAAVLVLSPGVVSHIVVPGQAIAIAVAAYLAAALLRERSDRRGDARVVLAGMAVVVVAMAIDLLLVDRPGPERKLAPAAFALFLLSPGVVLARRLSRALNAEERSRTLEENARLREDVERMSRHDLKTPLNSILGVARLLRNEPGLTRHQQDLVGVLQAAGLRMVEMVNLSLDLFKMETGTYVFRPQGVDLREVVARVLVDLSDHAQAHRVQVHAPVAAGTPVWVRAEELLCYSIIANLVKNAVEATPPGGRVLIALAPGDPVTLSIHNPGIVPPDIAARFFDKYVTGGKQGGSGLGTYSARLMARAQRGDLALRTDADGTTLVLSLQPLAGEPVGPAPREPLPGSAPLAALPAWDVLVVDDDELNRFVTREMLPSPPLHIETAPDGHAACEAMLRAWPQVLLLDMEMPGMDGLQTLRWVREHERGQQRPAADRCRVVMVSGNDDEASRQRAMDAGADRFLLKPVSQETLVATLRELAVEDGQR